MSALGRELPVITASRSTTSIRKCLSQHPIPCRHSVMDLSSPKTAIGKLALSILLLTFRPCTPPCKMNYTGAFLHRAHYARLLFLRGGVGFRLKPDGQMAQLLF